MVKMLTAVSVVLVLTCYYTDDAQTGRLHTPKQRTLTKSSYSYLLRAMLQSSPPSSAEKLPGLCGLLSKPIFQPFPSHSWKSCGVAAVCVSVLGGDLPDRLPAISRRPLETMLLSLACTCLGKKSVAPYIVVAHVVCACMPVTHNCHVTMTAEDVKSLFRMLHQGHLMTPNVALCNKICKRLSSVLCAKSHA